MKKTTIFLVIFIIISCSDKKKSRHKVLDLHSYEKDDISIKDSLFVGEPVTKDAVFIKNTTDGGFSDVDKFDTILNKHNDVFTHFKSNEIIKSINITADLSFELKRKKYKKEENLKDIQILFYTKFKGIVKDSIMFYKYQIDKYEGSYPQQRHETMSYIDEKLNLYSLSTYTSLSEIGVGVNSWSKYTIQKNSGKIKLIDDKLNYIELAKKKEEEIDRPSQFIENPVSTSRNENYDLDYSFQNTTFLYNCNMSDHITFSLNYSDFSCPSNEIRFKASLIKIDESNFELKYSEIKGYAIETSLDSKNYSKEISIGSLKYSNNKIEFTWLGFYNKKTKKREFTQNPFTGKVENSSINLQKCQ